MFEPKNIQAILVAAGVLVGSYGPLPAHADDAPMMPQPAATPSPSPAPKITWRGNLSAYAVETTSVNAVGALDTADGKDIASRADVSAATLTFTRDTGVVRFGATFGVYAFPVVGQAINPTLHAGANTDLYSNVPVAYLQLAPSDRWSLTVGKVPALLGQESNFTYQNANVQRGLAWNMEPAISRGIVVAYSQGKFSGSLGYTDGYYSGRLNAIEGVGSWTPAPTTTIQLAFILPQAASGPNPTATVANKRELNLMFTTQVGKLQILPYLLWVDSPRNVRIGYIGDERGFAAALLASYAFSPAWSVAARVESLSNRSSALDVGTNADLVGFGAGSGATTFTLTPAYRAGRATLRAEYSTVEATKVAPGLGFGESGNSGSQARFGLELGLQF